ncbi:MAG TPA: DUF6359 domain-containing protein [Cyclobacteriaceae bacterium]|nr:DUF6359 domain-containing protein [Cyclobacteriaceae bacterium]
MKFLRIAHVLPAILIAVAQHFAFAQTCDPQTGSATPGSLEYTLNPLKNRTAAPTSAQIDHTITLTAVLAPGNDETRFHTNKGAVIEGWVIGTKLEGKESCNCNKTDPKDRDYHIAIAKKKTETDGSKMMVVEVTPKVRAAMGWSTTDVTGLKGHKVKFTGWMFFDTKHKNIARNTHFGSAAVVRATCWEVHPVMKFDIVQ